MNLKVKYIIFINGMEVVARIDSDKDWVKAGVIELIDPCLISLNMMMPDNISEALNMPRVSFTKMAPCAIKGENIKVNPSHIISMSNVEEVMEEYFDYALTMLNKKQEAMLDILRKGKNHKQVLNEDSFSENSSPERDELPELFEELLTKKKFIN